MDDVVQLVRNERGNLVLGFKSVMKQAKAGNLKNIVVSTSVTEDMLEKLEKRAEESNIEILNYEDTSSKLGTLCGRAHTVAVLGLTK